jgi:hypothetical protein
MHYVLRLLLSFFNLLPCLYITKTLNALPHWAFRPRK